ncbi:hypothetical protein [Streptomyces sp. LN704]|uniref:hypothetical protein n=1 Tax=Streptomyces sp. LN704 TaxID=3112982 RepID=UPI003723B401
MGTSARGFGAADTAAEVSDAGAPGTGRPVPPDVRRWTGRTGPVVATPYEDRGTEADGVDRPASAGDPPGAESTGPGTAGPGPAGMTAGPVDVGIGPAAGGAAVGPSAEGVAAEEACGEREPERAPPAAGEAVDTEGPFAVRRGTDGVTTGSARRCTAGPAGALVSPIGAGGRVAAGGTAVTLGPVGPVAATGRLACRADGAPVRSAVSAGVATGKESEGEFEAGGGQRRSGEHASHQAAGRAVQHGVGERAGEGRVLPGRQPAAEPGVGDGAPAGGGALDGRQRGPGGGPHRAGPAPLAGVARPGSRARRHVAARPRSDAVARHRDTGRPGEGAAARAPVPSATP